MRLDGIHHVTCITGDAPAERRLLRRHARAAARQEDGQPGRPDRLPPLLRRRARAARAPTSRSSSTRARRAGARATGWCTASSSASARRSALDFWAERVGGERASTAGSCFDDPEGLALELVVDDSARRAARRAASRDPGRSTRSAASPACARTRRAPDASRARSSEALGFTLRLESARARAARGGFYVYDEPPAERGHSGRRHGAPRRLGVADGRARGLARHVSRRRAAPDAGDRPLLVPLDLLPRAERRALRDRDARRPGLRDRRGRSRRSASGSSCRRTSSTCARRSSRGSRRCRTRARNA